MASVSQCDVCNRILEHSRGHYIRLLTEKSTGATGYTVTTLEVCPDCYMKVLQLLHIDAEDLDEEPVWFKQEYLNTESKQS